MPKCLICPNGCELEDGKYGMCRARIADGGNIVCKNYGLLTSMALDPIEKKPLRRYMPGSKILSVGSFGCNLNCYFCQNHSISMASIANAETTYVSPEALLKKALSLKSHGNIGVAFTYNEPLISYEYILDSAKLLQENKMKNVLVTNGYINENPLLLLLPFIDALNIDLKGFTSAFYNKIGGDLDTVKNTIKLANKTSHVEITTLIIPDENESIDEMSELSAWISTINEEIPLHISRFFPNYKSVDKTPTSIDTIYKLVDMAKNNLKYVYAGNC